MKSFKEFNESVMRVSKNFIYNTPNRNIDLVVLDVTDDSGNWNVSGDTVHYVEYTGVSVSEVKTASVAQFTSLVTKRGSRLDRGQIEKIKSGEDLISR
ncbi:hypothetical protein phiST2_0070 [Vibrio phage phi-ST2]|uniref:Uncharacterized protein n=3 Tax=Schizotequatrovirus TaxID=1198137 RepID=A0A126HH68_9CAUD|nr:hypothetical protein CF80_gp088 [Vibrio phage VH7D]YP_009201159.1 hypothetical protein AVU32_gp056 [Vibrio phage ValKK3]ALP47213.1 hypothetical protein phiGrn1_0314 [Vibrio phage phi-Grn1]ALP47604.1 hypothetical protein phiST2_0070 [Vibrio phage phi-ST2]QBX06271.1 hypothetical protein Va3_318 [Vibrio phage Va3]QNJ54898.1 hypothetical protein vBValMR10Z_358 [Vibrio phage vB_ValM_R10Z]QNJ55283.1 hypothetical protein vBValMR11Z_357 [Vibrio phage vB_ValM_R11Z]URQ03407.1 hypothetical protein P